MRFSFEFRCVSLLACDDARCLEAPGVVVVSSQTGH
jgi:hypothetical protein